MFLLLFTGVGLEEIYVTKKLRNPFLSLTRVQSLPGAVKPSVTLESKFQSPRFLEIKRAFLSRQLPECHACWLFFFPSENEDELVQVAAVVCCDSEERTMPSPSPCGARWTAVGKAACSLCVLWFAAAHLAAGVQPCRQGPAVGVTALLCGPFSVITALGGVYKYVPIIGPAKQMYLLWTLQIITLLLMQYVLSFACYLTNIK